MAVTWTAALRRPHAGRQLRLEATAEPARRTDVFSVKREGKRG